MLTKIKEKIEYSILTAEISKATFGLTPSEYKQVKGLKSQNLRDHMTDLELIFSMLGEASTTKVTRAKNAKGFIENKVAAKIGGKIAGNALKELEKESGEKVITSENYLPESKKKKELTDAHREKQKKLFFDKRVKSIVYCSDCNNPISKNEAQRNHGLCDTCVILNFE